MASLSDVVGRFKNEYAEKGLKFLAVSAFNVVFGQGLPVASASRAVRDLKWCHGSANARDRSSIQTGTQESRRAQERVL